MRSGAAGTTWAACVLLLMATAGLAGASQDERAPADSGTAAEAKTAWSCALSGYFYIVPEDRDFLLPIVTADRGGLHLEARYNYEDFETASLFAGWNLSAGGDVSVEVTPMIGWVFGETKGVAPAAKVTLGYGRLELFSEAEYVFDSDGSSENFFYSWSELGFSVTDLVQAGLVGQRTRSYQSDLEYQRGIWGRYSAERFDLTGYVLNLGWDEATFVLAAGVAF